MLAACRNSLSISLTVFFAAISPGMAAEHFLAGRWQSPDGSFTSVGIIQYGETVSIFSEAGWSISVLEPETGGILASGEGVWRFKQDTPSIAANFAIGQYNGGLYLRIAPRDESGPSIMRVIFQPVKPPVTRQRT